MAMTELHFSLDALQRSKRRSSIDKAAYEGGLRLFIRSGVMSTVAKVAYDGALRLTDDRQVDDLGQPLIRDYTRKQRVFSSTLFDPDGNVLEPQNFWNRVEFHHKRGDAVVARTINWALPDELPLAENIKLAEDYGKILAAQYGVGVQVSVHRSRPGTPEVVLPKGIPLAEVVERDQGAENSNTHAHLTLSGCAVHEDGSLGRKVVELDAYACARMDPPLPSPLVFMRTLAAGMINRVLAVHGLPYRVEHTSFAARGIDQIPTIHEGNSDLRKAINECIRDTNAIRAAEHVHEPTVVISPEEMSDEKLVAYFDATHAPEDGKPLSVGLARQGAEAAASVTASETMGYLGGAIEQKMWYEDTKNKVIEDEARNLQERGEPEPEGGFLVRAARLVERFFRIIGLEKIAERIEETIKRLEREKEEKRIQEGHRKELLKIHARVRAGGSDADAALEEFSALESRLRARVRPTVEQRLLEQAGSPGITGDELDREVALEMRRYWVKCGVEVEANELFRMRDAAKTPPGEPGIKPGQDPDAGAPTPAGILGAAFAAAKADPTLETITVAYEIIEGIRDSARRQMAEESGAAPGTAQLAAALRHTRTALDKLAKANGFVLDKETHQVRPMTRAETRARDSYGLGD